VTCARPVTSGNGLGLLAYYGHRASIAVVNLGDPQDILGVKPGGAHVIALGLTCFHIFSFCGCSPNDERHQAVGLAPPEPPYSLAWWRTGHPGTGTLR
jgi:hypothetical protein